MSSGQAWTIRSTPALLADSPFWMSEESNPKRDQFYHYSETVRNVDVRSERAYVRMIKKRYITSLIGAKKPIYLYLYP